MRKKQQGFTLIELVAVIVILGALAVVALPRFIDLQGEAEQAAAEGVAGSLSAASALNYAGFLADSGDHIAVPGTSTLQNTSDATNTVFANLLQSSSDLDNYGIGSCSFSSPDDGDSTECELLDSDGQSFDEVVNFTAIATSV